VAEVIGDSGYSTMIEVALVGNDAQQKKENEDVSFYVHNLVTMQRNQDHINVSLLLHTGCNPGADTLFVPESKRTLHPS